MEEEDIIEDGKAQKSEIAKYSKFYPSQRKCSHELGYDLKKGKLMLVS